MTTRNDIGVVGVDHSLAALAALEVALEEGRAHRCAVEMVTAWLWSSPYPGMSEVGTLAEGDRVAAAVQEAALRAVVGEGAELPVVSRIATHDDAGHALVQRAEGARMLVVGNVHRGVLARAAFGSVTEYVVRHSPAPVLVVAEARRLGDGGRDHLPTVVGRQVPAEG